MNGTIKGAGDSPRHNLQQIPVARIRPEDGLGRRRDREGHRELCRSIEQFGVLTPITVRLAPDGSGDYLLIKGQGRTLACRLLGMEAIPALVVDDRTAETEKVQQFLVENVARLRMSTVDRALLIARARRDGEETAAVAKRFGVHPQTVRRLQAQLSNASSGEVAALRAGTVNLALHAVITRHVDPADRDLVVGLAARHPVKSREMEALLEAIGWEGLSALGPRQQPHRVALLSWALTAFVALPKTAPVRQRIRDVAEQLPTQLADGVTEAAG